jgi:hypothetical protein
MPATSIFIQRNEAPEILAGGYHHGASFIQRN